MTSPRVYQSVGERLVQLVVNIGLRAVQWESDLRDGKLTLTMLSFQISEVSELLAFTANVVSLIRESSPEDTQDILQDLDSNQVHGLDAKKVLDSLREAAFEPVGSLLAEVMLEGFPANLSESDYSHHIHVPSFLASYEVDIVETGKIVRLAKSLNMDPRCLKTESMTRLAKNPALLMDPLFAGIVVPEARKTVNKLLLDNLLESGLFFKEVELLQNYFLLYKADWISDVFEHGLTQLEKPIKLVNKSAISQLVKQHTAGLMSVRFDPFPLDELNLETRASDDSILAIKALTMNRVMDPRLRCIFTDSVIVKYQGIFRHLVHTRYTEHKLKCVWKEFKGLRAVDNEHRLFACHILLSDMIHFLHNYMLYLSMDVIGSKDWKFTSSRTVSVVAIHNALESILSEVIEEGNFCNRVYRTVSKIFSTCALFSTHMTRFIRMNLETGGTVEEQKTALLTATSQEQYAAIVQKFSDSFTTQTKNLFVELKADKTNPSAPALLGRLDFNGFYRDRMGIH